MTKKLLVFTFAFLSFITVNGEEYVPYKIKGEFIGGYVIPHDENVEVLVKGPSLGAELAVEFATDGSKPWQAYYNNPDVGVALQLLSFGNPEVLGDMVSVYPYINLPLTKATNFSLNIKLGGGLAFCTNPLDKDAALANSRPIKGTNGKNKDYNFAIGSLVNGILAGGANMEFSLNKNISLTGDLMFNHFSNGSTVQPNTGLNIFNGYVGLKYLPEYKKRTQNIAETAPIKKKFSGEVIFSGGIKDRYYRDTKKFPIGSLNLEGYYQTCHQHRIGIGLDGFYDGIYTNDSALSSSYQRTDIDSDELKNKIRVGVNIANELIIGNFIAGIQFGLYLYDPIKDLEPYETSKRREKGLIYAYNIQEEDGWLYTKLTTKYKITPNLLANFDLKMHLQKAEFVEFGLGYAF